jgi:hypothetical protein
MRNIDTLRDEGYLEKENNVRLCEIVSHLYNQIDIVFMCVLGFVFWEEGGAYIICPYLLLVTYQSAYEHIAKWIFAC